MKNGHGHPSGYASGPRRVARAVAVAIVVAVAVAAAAFGGSTSDQATARATAASSPRAAASRSPLLRLSPPLRLEAPLRPAADSRPAPIPVSRVGRLAATPCGDTPGLLCSDVVVPLDRTAAVPGTVTLAVETLPPAGPSRGVMFLIAGGPGQGSATVFGLGDPDSAAFYQFMFPGYTLVAFDNRGTGRSGLLTCSGLQGYYPIEEEEGRVGACAQAIGSNRVFYSTRDHAEDIEAVRQMLGVARVGLWGTSYGTKLSLAYALAHPAQVERLLLDSMVPTDLDDPFRANSLREMPKALADLCTTGLCRGATPDFAGDVVAVANRLAAKPARGTVLRPNGKRTTVRVTGLDVMTVAVDADLNPGLAAELPAVMRAARLGDTQPLLRTFVLDAAASESAPEELSGGLFAATVCNDGPFSWPADAPVAGRRALFDTAVGALPAGSLGPFGSWAAGLGNGHFCLGWPPPTGAAPLGPGPLPNVPVLAVNGGFDMRTPVASAQSVISRFPQGRLIVVNGVGHSVLSADPSFCAPRAVRNWMLGAAFSDQCARPAPLLAPISAYPPAKRSRVASPRETLSIALKTVREAEAIWLLANVGDGDQVAGLYGGRIVGTGDRQFRLVRYSITPGVELSGRVRFADFGPPLEFDGIVSVGGKLASSGLLGLSKGSLAGTLGGVLVG